MAKESSEIAPTMLVVETLFSCLVRTLDESDQTLAPRFRKQLEMVYSQMRAWETPPREAMESIARTGRMLENKT